nr:GreA/GreB family elongation factor [uncultured Faecalibacillus sp.]
MLGSFETDPVNGKISNESPLAKALIGHGVNEIVTVGVAEAYDVKIVDIEFTA